MRAGCFAERRVIDLFNRRFVPFYFSRGGPGLGHDEAASAFVDGQTENPWAYLAAFSPEGKILGETELYADKDAVFAWLVDLLEAHPEYAAWTPEEEAALAGDGGARVLEEMGDYAAADAAYERASASESTRREAWLARVRIARYEQDWERHAGLEREAREVFRENAVTLLDLELERGRRLLARGNHVAAREVLQGVARGMTGNPRLAEAHFYAGVACWFEDDRDWAKLHWCWVVEQLPADRLKRRAYVAAAAEAMPYANPELGGYEAPVGNIGPGHVQTGYGAARLVYERLLPAWERGETRTKLGDTPDPATALAAADAGALVRALRDGNAHVATNNPRVERLVELGVEAVAPLVAAIEDESFAGRGYAAWALGRVLAELPAAERPSEGLATLQAAREDADSYVRLLASSGGFQVTTRDRERWEAERGGRTTTPSTTEARAQEPLPKRVSDSPVLLVARLRDGNTHVAANNRIVDALEQHGAAAIPALEAALLDDAFPGRGYAAWALSQVLKANELSDVGARALLERAAEDEDDYVRTLARSGLSTMP